MEKLIKMGLVVTGFGFSNYGTFGPSGDPNYYVNGYCTTFNNGWKLVCGGGSASYCDFVEYFLFDENNNLIEHSEESF